MGIVKDRCIHLTHSQYLNDREECLLAVNKVRHDIETRQERASNSQDLYEAMLEDVPGDGFYTNVCVGSFSAANDSLPQWRAYGESGSGYALGFDADKLFHLASTDRSYIGQCLYGENERIRFARELVEEVLREKAEGNGPKRAGGHLAFYLQCFAPLLKGKTFKEEQEWRIIRTTLTAEMLEFRVGITSLVPFYRFPLCTEEMQFPLVEVVIGPTPNPDLARRAVGQFLRSQDLREVDVRCSETTFRGSV